MTENTNAPAEAEAPAGGPADPQTSHNLDEKVKAWLAGKSWTDAGLVARNVEADPQDPDVIWTDWRDFTFPHGRVRYIHPDARWRLARKCSFHKDLPEQPPKGDPCAEDRLTLAPARNRGSRTDRCDVPKSLCPKGQNGLARLRLVEDSDLHLFVEGIGQSGAAADWAPEEWNVTGMNGCWGIHEETYLAFVDGGHCVLVLDADRRTNPQVAAGAARAVELLYAAGAVSVSLADLPDELVEADNDGLDDVLARMVGDPDDDPTDVLAGMLDVAELQERPPDPSEPSGFVDLVPYLDGTFVAPEPSVGAQRADGKHLLYPGRWHTLIGLTGSGKTWFALWHVVHELSQGRTVVYGHFEEPQPVGTIARLRLLGVEDEAIRKGLLWLDCSSRRPDGWTLAQPLSTLARTPSLVVLDGINAACTQHGWSPDKPEAVGEYRRMFVTPATRLDATVLSLGHPPKSPDRQKERHGYGSTAWLDEVDGVGFRLEASNQAPIRPGRAGRSTVLAVKDRYGSVNAVGLPIGNREAQWFGLGTFVLGPVSDLPPSRGVVARLEALTPVEQEERAQDPVDALGDRIVEWLKAHGGRFDTVRALADGLRASRVEVKNDDLRPALERLAEDGRLEWPVVAPRVSRPGWLSPMINKEARSN